MLACKQCGEVRTSSKTFKAGIVVYTLRFFVCRHPLDSTKALTSPPGPPSR